MQASQAGHQHQGLSSGPVDTQALTGHQVLPILTATARLCTTAKFCSLPLEGKTLFQRFYSAEH